MVFLFNIKSSMHRDNHELLVDTPISVAYSHPSSSYMNHSKVKPNLTKLQDNSRFKLLNLKLVIQITL